jgi:putative aldouronate transport system substrate-binding protein
VFTADWYGYSRDVAAGLFSPLNDLLAQYAPETVVSLGEQFVKGSQIDGVNYGVPTEKELLVPGGLVFNKDLVDKYGFDITKVKTEADLEPMLQRIKENEPNIIPYLFDGNAYNLAYYSPAADFGDAIVNDDGQDSTVVWRFAQPGFVDHLKLMRKWYQAGYIHPDTGLDSFKYTDRIIAPGYFCAPQPLKGNNIKADELAGQSNGTLKLVEQRTANMFTHSGECGGSMLAIPVTSKDPARAMMFINLIHQNKDAVNLLAWGIEGVNYNKVAGKDGVVSVIKDNGYTNQIQLWTLGSQFLHYITENENPKKMELLKNYAKEGQPSNLLGFRYVPDAITNEKAAYDNIAKAYSTPILVGRVDPATDIPKFESEAKAAGLDKIMTDIQTKINDWKAKAK